MNSDVKNHYRVNEYFNRQYVQEEIMRDARHEQAPIIPFRKYRWINFFFKKHPIHDDPCVTDFEESPFSYQKNKMLLSLTLLIFIMFDNDQHISKKEKKYLFRFLKTYKKFFSSSDKMNIAASLTKSIQLFDITHYLLTHDIKKPMYLESLKFIKNNISKLKDYKETFKKLESLSESYT